MNENRVREIIKEHLKGESIRFCLKCDHPTMQQRMSPSSRYSSHWRCLTCGCRIIRKTTTVDEVIDGFEGSKHEGVNGAGRNNTPNIREGLARIRFSEDSEVFLDGSIPSKSYRFADIILTYLHFQGARRRVEGELPANPYEYSPEGRRAYSEAQQDMIDKGYTLVGPLEAKDESIHNPS